MFVIGYLIAFQVVLAIAKFNKYNEMICINGMKNFEDRKHQDIQTKIHQLKNFSKSKYLRKILLTLVGLTLTSLLLIIPVSAGQAVISILELDEKINIIYFLKFLLIGVYTVGIFAPIVRGFDIVSFTNVLALVFIGAFSGFFLVIF